MKKGTSPLKKFLWVAGLHIASALGQAQHVGAIAETDEQRNSAVQTYGTAHQQDGLGNTQIGRGVSATGFRFKAKYTGQVDALRFYLLADSEVFEDYAEGDGGYLQIDLATDDDGFPSENVLASVLVTEPASLGTRPYLQFSRPASVLEGRTYHLKFSNPHPARDTNSSSINGSVMVTDQGEFLQPFVPKSDLAVTLKYENAPWEVRETSTPIYDLYYVDGRVQGWPYEYGAARNDLARIDNVTNIQVREVFIPDRSRAAKELYVRVRRVGSPSSLVFQLLNSNDDSVVQVASFSPEDVPDTYTWIGGPFTCLLEAGSRYYVLIKENSGGGLGHYEIFPIADGSYSGFRSGFIDGWSEKYNGERWGPWVSSDSDIQFYFIVE